MTRIWLLFTLWYCTFWIVTHTFINIISIQWGKLQTLQSIFTWRIYTDVSSLLEKIVRNWRGTWLRPFLPFFPMIKPHQLLYYWKENSLFGWIVFSWCGPLLLAFTEAPHGVLQGSLRSLGSQAVGFSPLTPVNLLHKFYPPTSKSAMLFVLLSSQPVLLLLVVELVICLSTK